MLSSQTFFARLAATAARALFFIYVITVAAQVLPLKLLDQAWQMSVVNVVVTSSILPLQGLVLAHLAAYLNPSEPKFGVFCKNLCSWALLATLGFLLIIPLQSYNLFKGVRTFNNNAVIYRRTVNQTYGNLRSAVNNASTVADLKKRLDELDAPGLSPADNLVPLPILRPTLLAEIQKAETKALANSPQLDPQQIWLFSKEMVRSILTASAFALAFAAAAKRSAWPDSLLVRFSKYLGSLRKFEFTGLSKIVDNYKAKQKSRNELALSKRRLGDHARKQAELKQQEEKERRLREKYLKSQRAKQNRNDK